MIISVIPLIKLPRNLFFFDYEVPPDIRLEKFSLVIVPWRKSKVPALVVDIKNKNYKTDDIFLKKIIKTINQGKPVATYNQFYLISKLAKDFLNSPSIWWKTILPKFSTSENKNTNLTDIKILFKKVDTTKQKNKININLEIKNLYQEIIVDLISKLNTNHQQLILCPEIIDVNLIYQNLPSHFKKQAILYHKGIKNKELILNYFKILNNQASIIIGTKISVLLPFFNLKNIYVFKADNYGFTTGEQNPRYNLDQIYNYLNKIYGVSITLYTLSPWVDIYAYLKKEKQNIKNNQRPLNFKLIDMTLEKKSGNYTYISWPLEQAIKSTLIKNKKCLLLVNRKGLKQYIFCQDCGWQPRCNICGSFLKTESKNKLLCGVCQTTYPLPTTCLHCHSLNLKSYGLTNQTLVTMLKKILGRNDIVYIDSENKKSPTNANLVVATKFFLPRLNDRYGLIAFVDGDQELISYNYRSYELAWQFFNYAFRILPNCQKIIQTQKIDHFFWYYLSHYTYHKFWLKEMKWRKRMNFPPYKKIIKLIIKGKNQTKIESIKKETIDNLNKNFINFLKITTNEIVFSYSMENYKKVYVLLSKLADCIMIEFNPYEI